MNRLDEVIGNVAYVLDTLMAFRNIIQTGGCNDCRVKNSCKFKPDYGQMVRYNCPGYVKDGIEKKREGEK